MVKPVRFFLLLSVFCLFSSFSLGAVVTQTFTVAAEADDGIATAAGLQSISDAHLAIGDDRTYALPYQMSAMRFANIDIPRSAAIISANLSIRSLDSNFRGSVKGSLRAETTDNAPDYTGRNISDAPLTAAAVDWDHKSNWSANTWYTSPDIAPLIQQVIDNPNWQTSNAAALYYSTRTETGKQRFFAAYSTAPAQLEITFEYYTISGTVTTTEGSPLQGVQITAGPDIEPATTNASGYYELKVPPGWTGTVTATPPTGWGLTEWSHTYTNITTDKTAENFTAFQPTISGTTTQSGVTVTATGAGSVTSTPNYTITVPYGWTGTITAELTGYGFPESPRSYTDVTANKTGQNFTPYQPTISGSTEQAGATVTASGVGSVVSTPAYSITVPYGWSGTVSVSLTGYNFTESPRTYADITADVTNQNFTPYQPTISGNTGIAGATVTVSGVGSVVSTPAYSITVPYGWSGTVSASLTGYNFPESPRSYTNVTSNKTNQNFTPYQPTLSGSTGIAGATVTVSGIGSFVSSPAYSVVVPYGWNGTVEVSLPGYNFPESPQSYTNLTSDQANQDYNPFQPAISGSTGQAGVTVTISGVGSVISTPSYSVTVPYGWSGTVEVSRLYWSFEPAEISYSNVTADQLGQDYTGTYVGLNGSGTQENPYLIENAVDFDEFTDNSSYWATGIHTKLMTDIDLSGRTYTTAVIAPDTDNGTSGHQGTIYAGVFNGN